jgi:hypothetical protein
MAFDSRQEALAHLFHTVGRSIQCLLEPVVAERFSARIEALDQAIREPDDHVLALERDLFLAEGLAQSPKGVAGQQNLMREAATQ